jgi:hypothetical protein
VALDRRKADDPAPVGPHVEKAFELTARDAAHRAARKTLWGAAGGYFLLLLILFIGAAVYQLHTNRRLDDAARKARIAATAAAVTAARVDSAETRACERVQLQRERANVTEARDYLLMVAITQAPRASKMIRDEYAGLARTARYDPPTDCPAAVRHPGSYHRPASVPYCAADGRACVRSDFGTVFARQVVRAAQEGKPQPVKGA